MLLNLPVNGHTFSRVREIRKARLVRRLRKTRLRREIARRFQSDLFNASQLRAPVMHETHGHVKATEGSAAFGTSPSDREPMQALASRYTRSGNADEPANPSQNEKPMRQLVTKPSRQVAIANAPPSELGYSGLA